MSVHLVGYEHQVTMTADNKIGVFTVTYAVVEYRQIEVAATSQEEAEALVGTQEGLYSTKNPLYGTDRWIRTVFGNVIPRREHD